MNARPSAEATVELEDVVVVLRRRWLIIVLVVVGVCVGVLVRALLATPEYASSITVAVEPTTTSAGSFGTTTFGTQELETQLQILASEQVAARVVEELGLGISPRSALGRVHVNRVGDTRVLVLVATDVDPARAQSLAQTFAEEYLRYRREDTVARLLATSEDLQGRVEALSERIDELDRQIEGRSAGGDTAGLGAERSSLVQQLGLLQAQAALLQDTDGLASSGGQILRDASMPSRPSSPNLSRDLSLGLLLGAGLGLAAAFVRDRLDDRVKDEDAVASATGGRPVLARVPDHSDPEPVVMLTAPQSSFAEAIRSLRTNLRFTAGRQRHRTVMVTSAVQGEGKSVVALNLAVAAARAGDRVVIVDADLRRPRISALLGQPDVQGLAHVLSDQVPLDDAVQGSGVDGLVVLPAGGIPPNPAELLSERNLERVLTRVAAGCDLVIVDSPPVLAVTDAVEMSLVVEAVVLVVDAGRTGRRELREAARRLDLVGANVAGVVINRSARSDAVYYGYGAEDEPARGKPRGRRRRGAR